MDIVIKRIGTRSAEDFVRFFDEIAFSDHPEWGCGCYCCFYHVESAAQWDARTAEENRDIAREMIEAGTMKGLLAYDGDKPVGWCHFDDRAALSGLRVFRPEVLTEEEGIGSILCFTIAQNYRHRGIASSLLRAACDELTREGFAIAEAYPAGEDASDEHNYPGPLSMYLSQGFHVFRTQKKQTVVRKVLR